MQTWKSSERIVSKIFLNTILFCVARNELKLNLNASLKIRVASLRPIETLNCRHAKVFFDLLGVALYYHLPLQWFATVLTHDITLRVIGVLVSRSGNGIRVD